MQILCLDSILANDVDIVSSTSTMVVEEYEYEDKVQILNPYVLRKSCINK
jgi:hypothetical protein